MNSVRGEAISGVRWMSTSTVVVVVAQFVQLALLARFLSPEDFGLVSITAVVVGFAQSFGDMGLSNSIIHRQATTADELSSLYWMSLLAGVAVFGLLWAMTPLVAAFYNEPRLEGLMLWSALIFLIVPVGQQFQILLQKDLRFGRLAGAEVTGAIVGATIAVSSVVLGQGVFSLVWGQLASAVTKAALFARFGSDIWRPGPHFRWSDLRGHLSFGLYQMGERSVNYFSRNMDKLLIGRLLGVEALGFYSVAYQLMIRPMQTLNPIVTRVAFPVFARIQDDDARLDRGYLQVIQAIAFVSMPVYLGMFAVAEPLINLLLGAGWEPVVGLFQILVVLGVFYSLGNPVGSLLLAKGRADIGFWFNVFVLLVSVFAILAGSRWGVYGVAWALVAVCVAVLFPAGSWLRWRLFRMSPTRFVGSFAPFLALSAFMALVVAAAGWMLDGIGPDVARLGALSILGAAIYLSGVWLTKRSFLKEVFYMARGVPLSSGGK